MTTLETSESGTLVGTTGPRRSWRVVWIYGVLTVLAAIVLVGLARPGAATYGLASSTDLVKLPPLVLPGLATGVVAVVIAAVCTVLAVRLVRQDRRQPLWLPVVFAVALVVGLLTWATSGSAQSVPLPGLLAGSLALAVPLIFGALGGVISERVGVVNVAIEGQLLAGAFTAAVVASLTRSLIAGLVAAMVAGMLVSFVLAAFAIKYLVDQVIVGVVLNVLVLGLTNFLYSLVLVPASATLNSPPQFSPIAIPVLSAIPVIGPVLFRSP